MINEFRSNARSIAGIKRSTAVVRQAGMYRSGIAGALLGATWFGAAFPLLVTAPTGTASAVDAAVYIAGGVLFGVISGGTIGAVIGGRGR